MNRIVIEILGVKYPITTPEDPRYVKSLAQELDQSLRIIFDGRGNTSINQALILLSLNYLDTSRKSTDSADHLREQVAQYLEESAKANLELSEARAEIERLHQEIAKQKEAQARQGESAQPKEEHSK